MSQLELFRDALLVSLIAILVYILYKRLLHLMAKQNVQSKYPALDAETIFQDGIVTIQLQLQQSMSVKVTVISPEGKEINCIQDAEVGAGAHQFSFTTLGCTSGKYSFEVITPHEKLIRYFHIA